ncbi:unnamed protein product, partial [Ectocarpus sp. 6 AP-2014]
MSEAGTEIQESHGGDRDALLTLYHCTGGPSWHNRSGWGSDRPLNEWYGVTTNSAGRVVALELRYNNLQGSIPPGLGELGALEHLHLTNNELHGAIPPELGRLHSLTDLRLYCNHLSGILPPELGNLHALKKLVVYSNDLSGTVPPELEGLRALEELLLSDNKYLLGDIPPGLDRNLALNRHTKQLPAGVLAGMFSPIGSSRWEDATLEDDSKTIFSLFSVDGNEGMTPADSRAPSADPPFAGAGGGAGATGGGGATEKQRERQGGRRRRERDRANKPWVAKVLDSMAEAWHVVVPIADDVTSVWLLVKVAAARMGPLWWVSAAALSAAGLERAWLVLTLCAVLALMPLLGMVRVVLAGLAWCARLCTFPPGTVCCLCVLGCCWRCLNFSKDGPRCNGSTATRLL